MSDETVNENAGSAERVGFCQDCGKPLTRETVRTVGSGVFCEPCLEVRLAGGGAVPPYGAGPIGSGPVGAVPPPLGSLPPLGGNDPSPALAGLLGLIPGVGAMYNGQYAKGIAHFLIFTLLCAMGGVNGVGWVFVLCAIGWCFYQSFEAYHTAKARREGLPLPDPFGLNNIGAQVGQQFRATAPGGVQNPASYPGWSGYVPPQGGATPPPETGVPPAQAWGSIPASQASAAYASPYTQSAPYTPPPPPPVWDTPAWTPPPADQPGYPAAPAYPVVPVRRSTVPAAAVWLIGLGMVFLVFDLVPELRFSVDKIFPLLLMAFAVWLFIRRMMFSGGISPAEDEGEGYATRAVCFLRMPVFLFTIGVLWLLGRLHLLHFGMALAVLMIVYGVLLLLERSVGSRVVPGPVVGASAVNDDGKGN